MGDVPAMQHITASAPEEPSWLGGFLAWEWERNGRALQEGHWDLKAGKNEPVIFSYSKELWVRAILQAACLTYVTGVSLACISQLLALLMLTGPAVLYYI